MPISIGSGEKIQILVENQGRINFNLVNDFKGIIGGVKLCNITLKAWTITGFPLDNYEQLENLLQATDEYAGSDAHRLVRKGPTIFSSQFEISKEVIHDTYFDPTGWGKVRGFLR